MKSIEALGTIDLDAPFTQWMVRDGRTDCHKKLGDKDTDWLPKTPREAMSKWDFVGKMQLFGFDESEPSSVYEWRFQA